MAIQSISKIESIFFLLELVLIGLGKLLEQMIRIDATKALNLGFTLLNQISLLRSVHVCTFSLFYLMDHKSG